MAGGLLSAADFSKKIAELPNAPLLDVRTPDEYSKGHLPKAQNIDWNGADFSTQTAKLDKSKPVLLYCLSGGRSASAVSKMKADGFTEIYELSGGIMKWRAAKLPEEKGNAATPTSAGSGMTKAQFDALLNTDKTVLIDFYADWCAPCQKMKPYLEEIATEMADNVMVVRINADENPTLCNEMHIDALPILQVYKNKNMTWNFTGYIGKEEVVKQLK